MLPWAHGYQRKAIRDFVQVIITQQTGCQAHSARSFGNQEAATKRLSRLLHNERLEPRHLSEAVLLQALIQLPTYGSVRLAIDWTIAGHQHLLVVSLVVGRRALPIYWRAYEVGVLKGRMQRYELAVIRWAITRITRKVGRRRVRVVAELGVAFVMRVKRRTKVQINGTWQKLSTLWCPGNTRRRALGRLHCCARSPQPLWVTMSRQHDAQGKWDL